MNLKIFKRDMENDCFKYFSNLNKRITDLETHENSGIEKRSKPFSSIIETTIVILVNLKLYGECSGGYSVTYSRESFFATTNFTKPDVGATPLDTTSAACVALRTAKYTLITKHLASML
jgi:hypothetical protein